MGQLHGVLRIQAGIVSLSSSAFFKIQRSLRSSKKELAVPGTRLLQGVITDVPTAEIGIGFYSNLDRIEDCHFQFVALPFGLAKPSRVFKKILVPVLGLPRSQGILILGYLDDLLFRD